MKALAIENIFCKQLESESVDSEIGSTNYNTPQQEIQLFFFNYLKNLSAISGSRDSLPAPPIIFLNILE